MALLLQIIAASLAGGLLSLVVAALFTLGLPKRWLKRLVSFSAGVLLTTALLSLLPEALAEGMATDALFAWLLAGLLGFFALEKYAVWRHRHELHDSGEMNGPTTAASMILIGDAVHNFTDGLVIAAAFLVDPHLGWVTAVAIIAHEIPQEAGDFVLLLAAGWSKKKAFVWNGISSMASVLGGCVGYFWLTATSAWIPEILTIAAASFIYIAVSDLMPWLRREHSAIAWHGGFMAAGVALVPASLRYLH